MSANNFAQPAANAIAHNCAPERARGDKAGAKTNGILRRKDAKQNQLAAVNAAVHFYMLKFGGPSQAAAFGKCEAFDRADDVELPRKKAGTNPGRGD